MAQVGNPGKMQEYISNIEFSLNFSNKKSTKVRIGDLVFFDGVNARHVSKKTGQEFMGEAQPLNAAVSNNWLVLNVAGAQITEPSNVKTDKVRDTVVYKNPDYDPLKGGAFEEFLKNDPDTVVAGVKKVGAGSKVIREEDQVVKKVAFGGQSATPVKKTSNFEVSGDQVDVKTVGSTSVSNSTSSVAPSKAGKMPIIQSDDGHADHVIISKKKVAAVAQSVKPKNSFTVDGTTPNLPEDATMKEVRRAVTPIQFDESQDAQVVRKIGASKMPDEPNEQEGIVLRKTEFTKKQASGSTPVADLSGVKTQSEVNAIEKGLDKKEVASTSKSFIEMLPDDWSTLHWVKKEKFITQIDNVDFLKFILKVESIKAVQNACRKRMTELENQKQPVNG